MGALRLAVAIAGLSVAACGGDGDPSIWKRDFAMGKDGKPAVAATATEITGLWEGEIFVGRIRAKIEPARITLATRCESDGKTVTPQGSAPIALSRGAPATMTLQGDLAGGDDLCGFRFNKGDVFAYRLRDTGVLELNFAGASASRFRKLSDLETAN